MHRIFKISLYMFVEKYTDTLYVALCHWNFLIFFKKNAICYFTLSALRILFFNKNNVRIPPNAGWESQIQKLNWRLVNLIFTSPTHNFWRHRWTIKDVIVFTVICIVTTGHGLLCYFVLFSNLSFWSSRFWSWSTEALGYLDVFLVGKYGSTITSETENDIVRSWCTKRFASTFLSAAKLKFIW